MKRSTLKRSWMVECSNSLTDMSWQAMTSSSFTTILNLFQAKASLLIKVKEVDIEGVLDDFGLGQGGALDEGTLKEGTSIGFSIRELLDSTRGALPQLDGSTLALFWPRRLGRFPTSTILDTAFLFSKELEGTSFNVLGTFGRIWRRVASSV